MDGKDFIDPTKFYKRGEQEIPVINIGRIPVMLHTNACALRNMSSETLYQVVSVITIKVDIL